MRGQTNERMNAFYYNSVVLRPQIWKLPQWKAWTRLIYPFSGLRTLIWRIYFMWYNGTFLQYGYRILWMATLKKKTKQNDIYLVTKLKKILCSGYSYLISRWRNFAESSLARILNLKKKNKKKINSRSLAWCTIVKTWRLWIFYSNPIRFLFTSLTWGSPGEYRAL